MVMSWAYNSKNQSFPSKTIQEILLYDSIDLLLQDCNFYGLLTDSSNVYFTKTGFKSNLNVVSFLIWFFCGFWCNFTISVAGKT